MKLLQPFSFFFGDRIFDFIVKAINYKGRISSILIKSPDVITLLTDIVTIIRKSERIIFDKSIGCLFLSIRN